MNNLMHYFINNINFTLFLGMTVVYGLVTLFLARIVIEIFMIATKGNNSRK
jgi:hypothetical protein